MVKNVSYVKNRNENNPLVTQSYGADPGVIVYDDTIYIYTTNDSQEFRGDNENTYSKITSLNCYSSKDMVNWTDHGSFNIAGKNGAAKWSNNSWAPCIACKRLMVRTSFSYILLTAEMELALLHQTAHLVHGRILLADHSLQELLQDARVYSGCLILQYL